MTDRHSENARDYEVGYKRPPKEHQFKKGQSGNRRGRPKGRKNVATVVNDILTTPTSFSVNGRTQEVPAFAAAIAALLRKALTGDSRATAKVLELAQRYAPDVIHAEVDAEVERRLAEIKRANDDRFKELTDRMSPEQKRRLLKCMEGINELERECGLDSDPPPTD